VQIINKERADMLAQSMKLFAFDSRNIATYINIIYLHVGPLAVKLLYQRRTLQQSDLSV